MNVVALSAIHNGASYVDRYADQMLALRQTLAIRGDTLHVVVGEGDSTDDTRSRLERRAVELDTQVLDVTHGRPVHGSVINGDRFRNMAEVWASLFDAIGDADAVLFCEPDLIWSTQDVLRLLDDLAMCPVVGGMVWYSDPALGIFYDTWAYRKDGKQFSAYKPWHPELKGTRLVQIDSAGSLLAVRGDVARLFPLPAEDVIVGFCRRVRGVGGTIWLDQDVDIVHPERNG